MGHCRCDQKQPGDSCGQTKCNSGKWWQPLQNSHHVPSRNLASFEPTSDCQQRWNWDNTIETSSKECICSPRVVRYVDVSWFFPVLYPFTTRGLWGLRGLQLQLIKSILETLPVLDWIPQNGVPDFDILLHVLIYCLQANRPMKFYVRPSVTWKNTQNSWVLNMYDIRIELG